MAALQDKAPLDDEEWQAPGGARKRKTTGTSAAPATDKARAVSSLHKYRL
jgi:hypothetical protein